MRLEYEVYIGGDKIITKDFNTIEDFDYNNKVVLLRIDINCPLDRVSLEIINDSRIQAVIPTIKELINKKAKIVIIAHQGRKGAWDFISLDQHAKRLSTYLNKHIEYTNDIIGSLAINAINRLRSGDILLLGNVRSLDSETIDGDMFKQSKGEIVQNLLPYIDYYVCDAFSASHRSQCSLVGFPVVIPSASGRLMTREISILNRILSKPHRPSVFVLGGAKFGNVSKMLNRILRDNIADIVILVGLIGNAYLIANSLDAKGADYVTTCNCKDNLVLEDMQMAKKILI